MSSTFRKGINGKVINEIIFAYCISKVLRTLRCLRHQGVRRGEGDRSETHLPVCPICGEGEDSHAHVVCGCTHETMVKCRQKNMKRVAEAWKQNTRAWTVREEWADMADIVVATTTLDDMGRMRTMVDYEALVEIMATMAVDEEGEMKRGTMSKEEACHFGSGFLV